MARLKPIHSGEILDAEFLTPLGLSQYRLALAIRVPPRRINEIVNGQRGISADTALRLARFFGTSAELWMNLQTRFDLLTAQRSPARSWPNSKRWSPRETGVASVASIASRTRRLPVQSRV